MKRHIAYALLCLSCSLEASHAEAQASTGLVGNGFNVDLVTGPVRGSGRIVGLGGAYTALAYGADGGAWTPAAYAVRTLWENDWFEWDLAFDYSPATFAETDFDNDGQSGFRYSDFVFATLGGRFTFGEAGFGALFRAQDYRIGDGAQLSLVIANFGASYAFAEGQFVVGLSARTASLTISQVGASELVSFSGSGPELGAVFAPARAPFRIGASARTAVEASKRDQVRVAAGLALPRRLVLPAEGQVGFAYQFGPRPLNRRFENPHDVEERMWSGLRARRQQRQRDQLARERLARKLADAESGVITAVDDASRNTELMPTDPTWWAEELQIRAREEHEIEAELEEREIEIDAAVKALPREYLLLSAETVFTGEAADAVGLESFLSQKDQRSGEDVSVGFRFGAEGEPVQGWWKVRLGSYLEPSRFEGGSYRVHGTFDTDVRLFEWDIFGLLDPFETRIGASMDLAARYSHFGFGVGIWH